MQQTPSRESAGRTGPDPSANFLLLVLLVCGLGVALGGGWAKGSGAAFAFAMAAFVLGLCLHAFGHACAARRGGDTGAAAAGYLGLDPRRYADPLAALVLPVAFTILGGIGFPPGAIRLDPDVLRGRLRPSAAALAGPAMTLLFLAGLAILYHLASPRAEALRAVLAVCVLFQGTALILALVPIPGLDGYDALRPWLPAAWRAVADAGRRHAALVLAVLFLFSGAFSRALFRASLGLTAMVGLHPADVVAGYRLIRLW